MQIIGDSNHDNCVRTLTVGANGLVQACDMKAEDLKVSFFVADEK